MFLFIQWWFMLAGVIVVLHCGFSAFSWVAVFFSDSSCICVCWHCWVCNDGVNRSVNTEETWSVGFILCCYNMTWLLNELNTQWWSLYLSCLQATQHVTRDCHWEPRLRKMQESFKFSSEKLSCIIWLKIHLTKAMAYVKKKEQDIWFKLLTKLTQFTPQILNFLFWNLQLAKTEVNDIIACLINY